MSLLVSIFVLTLAWTSACCNGQRDKLFFLEKSTGGVTKTLLVVTWEQSVDDISEGCEIFSDKDLINEVLKSSVGVDIRTLSEDEMENLLQDCTVFSFKRRKRESDDEFSSPIEEEDVNDMPSELRRRTNRRGPKRRPNQNTIRRTTEAPTTRGPKRRTQYSGARKVNSPGNQNTIPPRTEAPATTAGYAGLPVIFPGTKWCGAGDIAKHFEDLGIHEDTDRCCRAHDHCNDTMAPGETRNNLTNNSAFTKLNCQCDNDFFSCLNDVNSIISNTIGHMYFNILMRDCYIKDYPKTSNCIKYRSILKIKCLEYEKDPTAKPTDQWIPAKIYLKIPLNKLRTVTIPF